MRNHAPNAVSCLKRRASRSSATHPNFVLCALRGLCAMLSLEAVLAPRSTVSTPLSAAPLLLAGFALG